MAGAVARIALMTAGFALLVSCSGGPPGPPYAGEFEQARTRAASDFEKQVLADDKITRPEYEEAVRRYVTCMKARGLGFEAVDSGYGYFTYVENPTSADHDAADVACREGTTYIIEALYTEIITNPSKRDVDELRAECFVRTGLAPKSYSTEASRFQRTHGYENAPFDKEDPRFQRCIGNPSM